jgi:uncharacterized protein (DUF1810 family)
MTSSLERFVRAQATIYDNVVAELRAGRKTGHWMWFIFPQLKGLGITPTASFYGLEDTAEAAAYLVHPILGSRLRECTEIVNGLSRVTALEIFGMPDALKFRSSMTLFESIAQPGTPFSQAIERYFDGKRDEKTLRLVQPVDPGV